MATELQLFDLGGQTLFESALHFQIPFFVKLNMEK